MEQWRHTRLLAASMYNANRVPDSDPILPHELLPLPGDEDLTDSGPAPMTAEEIDAAWAAVGELDKDWLTETNQGSAQVAEANDNEYW